MEKALEQTRRGTSTICEPYRDYVEKAHCLFLCLVSVSVSLCLCLCLRKQNTKQDTHASNPNPHQNSLMHSWHLHLSLCLTSALLHSVMCYAEYEWRRHWNRQGGAHTPSVNPTGTTRRCTVCVCVTLSVSYSIAFHHTDSYPFFLVLNQATPITHLQHS